jgi:hypothetical protein
MSIVHSRLACLKNTTPSAPSIQAIAILVALFHGAVAVMILKGDAKESSSLGESAMIMGVSLLVAASSIIFTGGGALIGLFFIALYFGGCVLFGKRRY